MSDSHPHFLKLAGTQRSPQYQWAVDLRGHVADHSIDKLSQLLSAVFKITLLLGVTMGQRKLTM